MQKAVLSYRMVLREIGYLRRLIKKGGLPIWVRGDAWVLSRILSIAHAAAQISRAEKGSAEHCFGTALAIAGKLPPSVSKKELCKACMAKQIDEPTLRLLPLALCALELHGYTTHIKERKTPSEDTREAWRARLYATLSLDFEEIWESVSAVEKALSSEPSGIYIQGDRTTKAAYRTAVYRLAQNWGTDELHAVKMLASRAKSERKTLTELLFEEKKTEPTGLYFAIVSVCTVLSAVCVGSVLHSLGVWRAIAMAVLLLSPIYAFYRAVFLRIFAKFCTPKPLLSLASKQCPKRGVLTVITTLLSGEHDDKALFDALELYYLRNRGEGRVFGILGDLPQHTGPEAVADESTVSYAEARIDALRQKYGDCFCLYVRKRRYAASEKRFFGNERKRGALLALARYLRDGNGDEFYTVAEPKARPDISYICTLDADTVLPYGAIDAMLCVMEHPYNRPVIRGGRVVQGIGILQPSMTVSLSSASESLFTALLSGKGGYDPYGRYAKDTEDTVFGHGGFCGKGMFHVDTFLAVLDGAFPKERILSHDFLEGQRLACRAIPRVIFSDTTPKRVAAYYTRQERWVRGDVQALLLALPHVRGEDGKKEKNPLPFVRRLRIFDHVLYAFVPIATVRAVLFLAFAFPSLKIGFCLLAVLFASLYLPTLLLCFQARAYAASRRIFSGTVLSELWHSLLLLCYRLIFACHEGIINAKAMILAFWRMCISKKHLLSWTTASEAERSLKNGSFLSYAWYFRYSVLFGGILLFAPQPLTKLLGALWLLSPICAYILDQPIKKQTHTTTMAVGRRLRAYAAPIWRYFEEHVTASEHHLPPDNVQWFGHTKKCVAHRTSPTNIGLYLLSCLSALRFSLITPRAAVSRLLATLETLEALEICHGHFYNWYDTARGTRIGAPYLSCVDSGNLACALVAAAKACERYAAADMRFLTAAKKMLTIAENMDFSIFYNAWHDALAIGFDTEKNEAVEGYYDLYASEARSAVYFAVAMGQIPSSAWDRLARPLLEHDRHIGICSWTGSAFEYFMPALWLSVPPNSLSEEALAYAARMQSNDMETVCTEDGCYTLFGRSEGAYFAFDENRIYQYQPCGVAALGAKANLQAERLIMPYATFLMLPFAKGRHAALAPLLYENLDHMEAVGMWGDYGFYEALDLTPSRVGGGYATIRSVMAHHLGMSLIALANTAFDDLFPTCFAEYAPMRAGELLLCERVPTDAVPSLVSSVESNAYAVRRQTDDGTVSILVTEDGDRRYAVLSNTHAFVVASSAGALYFQVGKTALTVPPISSEEEILRSLPPLFLIEANGRVYSPCLFSAMDAHAAQFSFSVTDESITYTARYTDGVTAILAVSLYAHADVFSLTLSLVKEGSPVPFTLATLLRPTLCQRHAYAAHATFCDLFLSLSVKETEHAVTVRRRPRGAEEQEISFSLYGGGLASFGAQTALDRILPMGYDRETLLRLPLHADDSCVFSAPSSAIVPAVFLKGSAHGKTTLTLVSDHGEVHAAPHTTPAMLRAEHRMLAGGILPSDETLSAMLYAALYRETRLLKRDCENVPYYAKETLYRFGISGDLPIFLFALDDTDAWRAAMQKTLYAWKYLVICGIRADLVFALTEKDLYERPLARMLDEMIRGAGLSFYQNKAGGGIFTVSSEEARDAGLFLLAKWTWGAQPRLPDPPLRVMAPRHTNEMSYAMDAHRVVLYKGRQSVPWSHILTNGVFSTLVTGDTLGFTFFINARECRVTPWYPEALSCKCGEHLYLQIGKYAHDLCATAVTWEITPEKALYIGHIGGIAYEVHVSVPDRRKRKEMKIRIANMSMADVTLTLSYEAEVLLGVSPHMGEVNYVWKIKDGIAAKTATNNFTKDYFAEFTLSSDEGSELTQTATDRLIRVTKECVLSSGERWEICAALTVLRAGERHLPTTLPKKTAPIGRFIDTGYPYFDALANTWLPVQIYHSRLWARCGFWQPGGAYGFRDQLQDAMAAVYLDPDTLKVQIYRSAAHEYREGDVQHWWHALPIKEEGAFHRGIRSRCSDDYLWLPLACAHYIEVTGDIGILETEIRYLESPPLAEGEGERYEAPRRSDVKESLYMHCIRALEHGFSFGAHGLPLIGSGDWNDGMNAVGTGGKGESVWGGMFLLYVLAKFLPLCERRGDEDGARRYAEVMHTLAISIETHAWNGGWYRRAWYDDGTPIGEVGQAEAEIDLLPQAFAAIVNREVRIGGKPPFDAARVRAAMLAAYARLYDEKSGTFALLAPPFSRAKGMHDPGYIAAYTKGVRENGGQYTHAAVWGAMGLFAIGEDERGLRVMRSLSPMYLTSDKEGLLRYQKEPYAMCGDVLRAEGRWGEGGWSLYTGSAAWYLRLLLSAFGKKEQEKTKIPEEEGA